MYMGHIGVALAGKQAAPRVPLWILVMASLASDLLDGFAGLAGIQDATIYPISHSLPGGLGLALIAALVYAAFAQEKRGSALVGFVTFSHVLADLITSRLPAWPNGPDIGLHLYPYDVADFAIEGTLICLGWLLYRRTLPDENCHSWLAWLILIVPLGFQLYFQTLPVS
jgi:hypothetical protein